MLWAGIQDAAFLAAKSNNDNSMNWIKKNWKMVLGTAAIAIAAVYAWNKFAAGPLSAKLGKDVSA